MGSGAWTPAHSCPGQESPREGVGLAGPWLSWRSAGTVEEHTSLLPPTGRLLLSSDTISNVLGLYAVPMCPLALYAQQEDTDDCKRQQVWLAGPGARPLGFLPDLSVGQLVGPFTVGASALPSVKWAAHMSVWRRHLVGIQMFVASRWPPSSVPPANSPPHPLCQGLCTHALGPEGISLRNHLYFT